jgi:hypothetical protein
MSGIVITNNLALHDYYGVFGSDYGYGAGAIAYYLPDATLAKNVLAGGEAYEYPSGFLFPSVSDFTAHFVNYAGGDFALVPGTDWANAGTDGLDLGADMAKIRGISSTPTTTPAIVTTTLPAAPEGALYNAPLAAQGGRAPYKWSLYSGTLPSGIQLDPIGGALSGVAVGAGDTAFTIQVSDADARNARQPLTLHVEAAIQPVVITTTSLPAATLSAAYSTALTATGGHGAYLWARTAGTLPSGLSVSSTGVISGTPLSAGTFTFTVKAVGHGLGRRWDCPSGLLRRWQPGGQRCERSLQLWLAGGCRAASSRRRRGGHPGRIHEKRRRSHHGDDGDCAAHRRRQEARGRLPGGQRRDGSRRDRVVES